MMVPIKLKAVDLRKLIALQNLFFVSVLLLGPGFFYILHLGEVLS